VDTSEVPETSPGTGGAQSLAPAEAPPASRRRFWLPRIRSGAAAAEFIALAAFVLGLGNGLFAYCQLQSDQAHESRLELTDVVQRLSALQRSAVDINEGCLSPDLSPQQRVVCQTSVLGLQAEQRVLVDLGRDLTDELGSAVNSSDYRALAVAMSQLNDNAGSERFLDRAVEVAGDVQDRVAAIQLKANLRFVIDPDEGRRLHAEAIDAIDHGSFDNELDRDMLRALAYAAWVNNETALGGCGEAADTFLSYVAAAREIPEAIRAAFLGGPIPDDTSEDPTKEDLEAKCEADRKAAPGG